jgi:hypothetical protein
MKICTKCKIEKPQAEFHQHRSHKDGLREQCKVCVNKENSHYRKENREKIKEMNCLYRDENKEKLREKRKGSYQRYLKIDPDGFRERGREYARLNRERNPEKTREATRKWREANPEKYRESARRTREKGADKYKKRRLHYREENREKILERNRLRYQANPEKYRETARQWAAANREKILERKKEYRGNNRERLRFEHSLYCRNRRNEDVLFKLITNTRAAINRAIIRNSKRGRAIDLLGCSIEKLKKHIESQFKQGMSWKNWSLHGWHIDHKIPISSFNLSDPEQQRICFNYKNLQPLWAIDNLKKHAKLCLSTDEIKNRMAF